MRYLGLLICTLASVFCFTSVGYAHTQTQKSLLIYSSQTVGLSNNLSKIIKDTDNNTTINTATRNVVGRKVRMRRRT